MVEQWKDNQTRTTGAGSVVLSGAGFCGHNNTYGARISRCQGPRIYFRYIQTLNDCGNEFMVLSVQNHLATPTIGNLSTLEYRSNFARAVGFSHQCGSGTGYFMVLAEKNRPGAADGGCLFRHNDFTGAGIYVVLYHGIYVCCGSLSVSGMHWNHRAGHGIGGMWF